MIKSTGSETDFSGVEGPITFFEDIKTNKITIEQAKVSQKEFYDYLKTIRIGNKTKGQENTLKNINMLFNGRNNVINFIESYGSMILEAKKRAAEEPTTGKDLKY